MFETDVVIVGAGPAGAIAALNLAPTRHVVLVERRADKQSHPGESLPPAARRLLSDMGLLDEFLSEGHLPCYGNRARWGDGPVFETHFLHDADGNGWHLDRARFDAWLRRTAVRRGSVLAMPARFDAIERDKTGWRVKLTSDHVQLELLTTVVIDCGGRAAPVARRLGALMHRAAGDKLVCAWMVGGERPGGPSAGFSLIEAVEDGWWYTAPIAGQRRVLAFFTDADLPGWRSMRKGAVLLASASTTAEIGPVLAQTAFVPIKAGSCAAYNCFLEPCAGPGWVAAGDASMSFDPISSQGLLHALFTGLAAAEAADRYISGDLGSFPSYQRVIYGIKGAYESHLQDCYAAENRWLEAPFWQRRRNPSDMRLS